jgi:hypothetical protein
MSDLYTVYAFPEDGRRTLDTFDALALAGLAINSEDNGIPIETWEKSFALPEGEVDQFLAPLPGALGLCQAKAIVREFRTISEEIEMYDDFLEAVNSLVQWYYLAWYWADELGVSEPLTEVASYLAIALAEQRDPESLCLDDKAYAQAQDSHSNYCSALLTLGEIAEFIPDDEAPSILTLVFYDV